MLTQGEGFTNRPSQLYRSNTNSSVQQPNDVVRRSIQFSADICPRSPIIFDTSLQLGTLIQSVVGVCTFPDSDGWFMIWILVPSAVSNTSGATPLSPASTYTTP